MEATAYQTRPESVRRRTHSQGFLLVHVASQRAKQLIRGARPRVPVWPGAKAHSLAVQEVLAGKVPYVVDWEALAGQPVVRPPAVEAPVGPFLLETGGTIDLTDAVRLAEPLIRSNFGSWGSTLDAETFWRAVALLGVLGAVARPSALRTQVAAQAVIDNYRNTHEGFVRPRGDWSGVKWDLPKEHLAAADGGMLVDAEWLAGTWDDLQRRGRRPLRLVSAILFANHGALTRLFHRSTGACFYCPLAALTAIGPLSRPPAVRLALDEDPALSDTAVDVLALRGDPVAALSTFESFAAPIRARYLVLLTEAPPRIDSDQHRALEKLRARTVAEGLALLATHQEPEAWRRGFLAACLRNAAIDGALIESAPDAPILLFDRAIFVASGRSDPFSEAGRILWHRFADPSIGNILADLPAADFLLWQHSPRAEGHREGPRRLQVTVTKGDQRVSRFEPAARYALEAWIGREAGALAAAFPESLLPQGENGHLLTVTFFAPGLLDGQPIVETVYLPQAGDSTHCRFLFQTNGDGEAVEARLTIAYRNRILQSYLLIGATDGAAFTLTPEMATQADWQGLSTQSPYGASLVINRLGGQRRAVVQRGLNALSFSLENIDKVNAEIDARFNSSKWDTDEFKTMKAAGSSRLILTIAKKGFSLVSVVKQYAKKTKAGQALLERVLTADPIQVLAANLGARLPVEFFYANPHPDDDAALCPTYDRDPARTSCDGCPDFGQQHYCPLGLWSLRKVIEWHDFDEANRRLREFAPREFAIEGLTSARQRQRHRLQPATTVLVGVSSKAGAADTQAVPDMLDGIRKAGIEPIPAKNWAEWRNGIAKHKPSLLLLLPHTSKSGFGEEQLEIGDDEIAAAKIDTAFVSSPDGPRPIVLLVGCNTDNLSNVGFRNIAVRFMDGAAIVVSTITQVLGRHAAPLAADLVSSIAGAQSAKQSTFGQVMLDIRRKRLRMAQPPISLGLKCYGDARWRF